MPQEARVFSLINTRIFQKEKDSSLFIWLHHMPTEVVMHFTEPMLQERLWQKPNAILVDRKYDKPGQKSKPEWGISYTIKNKKLIEKYKAENFFG